MRVMDLGSTMTKLLRKQVRRQECSSCAQTTDADGRHVCLPSSTKPAHLPCRDHVNPTQPRKGRCPA